MTAITYEKLAAFAQTGGMIYFAAIFVLVVLWVFRPANKAAFDHAAHLPLADDQGPLVDGATEKD